MHSWRNQKFNDAWKTYYLLFSSLWSTYSDDQIDSEGLNRDSLIHPFIECIIYLNVLCSINSNRISTHCYIYWNYCYAAHSLSHFYSRLTWWISKYGILKYGSLSLSHSSSCLLFSETEQCEERFNREREKKGKSSLWAQEKVKQYLVLAKDYILYFFRLSHLSFPISLYL